MKERADVRPSEDVISPAALVIADSPKIAIHRSNFYKQLLAYPKVTKIGLGVLDQAGMPLHDEHIVPSESFSGFLVGSNDLPTELIEDARIEIISPVLREGPYRWRGIYEGKAINFSMNDLEFKSSVLNEIVSFQHGSAIDCLLKIRRKIDDSGNEAISGYDVTTVVRKIDGQISTETVQGKRYKWESAAVASQQSLFDQDG